MPKYACSLVAAAAVLSNVDLVASQKVVKLSFTKQSGSSDGADSLASLKTPEGVLYNVDLTIGTPPQTVGVQLDTGSSDLWVPSQNSTICTQDFPIGLCNPSGKGLPLYNPGFDSSSSSTVKVINETGFDIKYGDGTLVHGGFIQDTVILGGIAVPGANIALATSGSSSVPMEGILGVGFPSGESTVQTNGPNTQYPSLLEVMKQQGIIKSKVYSIYLDEYDSNTGSIVFGGIDKAKFSGDLHVLPIVADPENNITDRLIVPWTSFTINTGNGPVELLTQPIGALLDTGGSTMSVTSDIASSILNGLNISSTNGQAQFVCSFATKLATTFNFGFNNDKTSTISINLDKIVVPALNTDGTQLVDQTSGEPVCNLPIDSSADSFAVLGDPFLRSVYAVFDFENNQIGLGQANLNSTDSNIVEVDGPLSGTSGSSPTTASIASLATTASTVIPSVPTGTAVTVNSLQPTLSLQSTGAATAIPSSSGVAHSTASQSRGAPFGSVILASVVVGVVSMLSGSLFLLL